MIKSRAGKAAAIIALGICGISGIALGTAALVDYRNRPENASRPEVCNNPKETRKHECGRDSRDFSKRENIEAIVRETRTPNEAFEAINCRIRFYSGHDPAVNHKKDYWSSLQETWQTGTGDCDDGAIAFRALLSDNPEYDVRLVFLKPDKSEQRNSHLIAVYRDSRVSWKWGYVSFNNEKSNGKIQAAVFDSLESAVRAFNACAGFRTYKIIPEYAAEEVKFGANLKPDDIDSLPENPIEEEVLTIELPVMEIYLNKTNTYIEGE